MKKIVWMLLLVGTLLMAGCSLGKDDDSAEKDSNTDVVNETENNDTTPEEDETKEEPEEEQTEENNNAVEGATAGDMPDLQLQVQKADEEAGITIENNEIYSQLAEVIKADPKAGIPNDFSVYPHDIVYNEDGSSSVLFIGVNRTDRPIRNISFDLTLGDNDGNYIFEGQEVLLDENSVGVLQQDSAVPFLLGITKEDEDIFKTLNESNVDIRLDNAQVDFVE